MSEENTIKKAPAKRGRPKSSANSAKLEQSEKSDSKAKESSKKSPRKSKTVASSVADFEVSQNLTAQDTGSEEGKRKRGRPKRTPQSDTIISLKKDIDFKKASTKFDHVSKEYIFEMPNANAKANSFNHKIETPNSLTKMPLGDASSSDLLQDTDVATSISTAPKRKPGRPAKKQVKKTVISFLTSEKKSDPLEESKEVNPSENVAQDISTPSTDTVLAISPHERVALSAHERLALSAHERLALESSAQLAITDSLETVSEQNTQGKRSQNSRGKRKSSAQQNSKNLGNRGRGRKKTANVEELNHNTQTENGQKPDFIVGMHGTTKYAGSQDFKEFSEHGALGVLGIIDEAPFVEAVLPLVKDVEGENEDAPQAKKSRHPKAKGKNAKSSKANKFNKLELQNQDIDLPELDNVDSGLTEFFNEAAPIAEGDELALIEAEENVRQARKAMSDSKKSIIPEPVTRVLYVSSVPDEQVEVVITENGIVSEYFIEMAHQAKIRGNIYKGVINNVDTNLQAAFVNFGCGKNGFLQIDEVHPEYWNSPHVENGKYPPIQKVLKVGQEVLVQVVKEPSGSKGAFLTTWISLAGRFIVLTPGQEQIGVSRKVEDNAERARLRELLVGINPGENMGVIIRTASEGASKVNIQNDLKFLKRAWKDIQKKVQIDGAPHLIYQEADLASRAVRDYLTDDISELWVDSEQVRDVLQDLVSIVFPKNKNMLKLHKDARHTLWERFNILRQIDEVTKREVVLPSGGRLVFDQTEALMAIDINSGKTHGKSNFEAMVFRTNMEAVEAIARHLRLRDIGGQVVIDFIEMRERNHCREVEKAMRNAMKRDRARHDVGRLSSFGLLELVRQRTGTSAISISSESCPHCHGTGFRRNLEWQSQGILREIKSKLSGKNVPHTYVHHVDQEVAFYILNKKRDRLSEMEEKFNIKIEIHVK